MDFFVGPQASLLLLGTAMPVNPTPINGTPGNDTLLGTPDDDTFNSIYPLPVDGGGEDRMSGGGGDDTYYVNSPKDIVIEAKDAGIDSVFASISYKLGANVEKLVLTGVGNLTGTGNELANEITGNDSSNILDGGKGADLLHGGAGDDTYIFDNVGDVADETSNSVDAGGNDTIKSSVFSATFFSDASQHPFIENFTYTGKLAWTFTGDAQNNRITGSVASDTLNGGDGSDLLNGGKGADQLFGGKGDDTYIIDNKADRVFEATSGEEADSHDLIRSSLSIDLNAAKLKADKTIDFKFYEGVEDVVLTGKAALKAYGRDDESNSLTGNVGNNLLDGKGGNDTLYGGGGKDTLIGGTGDDFADGGEGIDTLVFTGSKDDYTVRLNADGSQLVRDDNPDDGDDGSDGLINVEMLKFADVKKGMAVPAPIIDADTATPNVLNEEDASQNGLPAGILAQAEFPGDLQAFYSLVNPGGIFSINSTTGEVTVEHGELLDFEANNGVYKLIVRATAEKGPALETEFAITIINKADQPADTPTINQDFLVDTGIADHITADTTPTISGTSTEIGGQIFVYDTFNGDTTLVATTTVLFGGTWNVTLTKLDDGVHLFKAAVQDLFGNPSELSTPLTIEIDTVTPFAPTGLAVTAATDSGLSGTDGITNNTTPTISGQAAGEDGSLVHLYKLSGNVLTEIGTGVVDAQGNWTAAITSPLTSGLYDIRATIEDGAGHVGPISNGYRLTIDTNAPVAPTLTLSPASNSGSQADTITNDTTPTLRGTTEANAKVHVFDGSNVEIGSAIADSTGSWSFTVTSALAAGSYNFTAQAEDVAGNLGPASGALVLTINGNNAPAAPTLDPASDSGLVGDAITNDSTPTVNVSGSGTIHLFQNGIEVSLTGSSYTPAAPLPDGEQVFTVTVDGVTDASAALIVGIDTLAPTGVALSNPLAVDENKDGPAVVGTLTATDAHAVSYALGGTDATSFTLGSDGRTLIYTGTAVDFEAPKTSFSLTVTATDAAANQTIQNLTVNVRDSLETLSATQTVFFLLENNVATSIATLSADGGATLSLVGDTASFFTLNGGTLSVNANLNFEDALVTDADNDLSNGKQLVATVKASNGIDTELFHEVTLTVVDVQEARTVSAGDSILVGGIGSDKLTGGNNSDTLIGNGGDDLLIGNSGGDLLDGGDGKDTVSYVGSTTGVSVNLSSGEAKNGDANNDGLISIENVTGSDGNDTLIGDNGDNVLEGGLGNDVLNGGNHGVYGDTVSYAGAASAVSVNLAILTPQNTLGGGTDTISNFENIQGSAFNDTLTGNSFDNVLIGGAGADNLIGGGGHDTASYFNATAAVIANLATGGTGGDAAGDTYTGIANLIGSIYADTLIGDGMANVIAGGGGHDILTGGGGNDVFKYQLHPGALLSEAHSDTITDFTDGEDKIDLSDLNLTKSGALTFEDLLNDGSLVLKENKIFADLDGGGDHLVQLFALQNVQTDTLDAADFIL
jgi:Ca2+-binding RTX toxin-like protein